MHTGREKVHNFLKPLANSVVEML